MNTRKPVYQLMWEWARKRYGRDRGLNADWSVSAFLLQGRDLKNGLYLLDNEDDTWSIVQRVWTDDYSDITELYTGTASRVRKYLTR